MIEPSENVARNDGRLDWYQEAKFGLFIHWGAYSVAGVEASWPIMAPDLAGAMFNVKKKIKEEDYVPLAGKFNPVNFNPDEWVCMAKEAGVRYIVITAKHHDGFCMFDAPGTDYKITNTPFGRDVCLELAKACTKAGMRLGFYYSPPDMHHPGYRDTSKPAVKNWVGEPKRKKEWSEYLVYMESHIRKLLTDYGEVSVIWFDGLANHLKYDPPRFHKLIHDLSPNTLINDRLGDDYDFTTPEQFIPKKGIPSRTGKPPSGVDPGGDDFFNLVGILFKIPGFNWFIRKQLQKYADGTLELVPVHQEPYPSPDRFQPWETCMTMGLTWAYNPDEANWKAPGQLVRNLVEVVSRGGNYLLDVGPTGLGNFPPEATERLAYVGKWMDAHHEAIYGSTYTPLQGLLWGKVTRKGDKLYLHVFEWPANGRLAIDGFPGPAKAVHELKGEPLPFSQDGSRLVITLPPRSPDPDVSVLEIDIDASAKAFTAYSPASATTVSAGKYTRKMAKSAAIVNSIINGLLVLFTNLTHGSFTFGAAAVDVLISVWIIAFLNCWLLMGSIKGDVVKGNIAPFTIHGPRLPRGAAMRALILSLACTALFGGLALVLPLYLICPSGMSNWAYIVFKTIYTGIAAAVAVAMIVHSVLSDANREQRTRANPAF